MKNSLRIGLQHVALMLISSMVAFPASNVYSQCDTILALSCDAAPLVPLENYCGRTNVEPYNCCNGWCGANTAVHNPTYHAFIALDTYVEIQIDVLPCSSGNGLQAAIIPVCPWENSDILDCDPGTPPGGTMVLDYDDMIPGEQYWLLVDGTVGAMCNFLISNVIGAFQPNTPVIFLQTAGTTLNAVGGNPSYTYAWFECEANEVIGTDSIFEAPGPGCYCVTVRDTQYASTFCTEVITTGIGEQDPGSISIYPNPSTSVVNIAVEGYTGKNLTLSVFDYQGRRISESLLQEGTHDHIWKSGQAAGVYLFVISSDDEVITRQPIVYTGR